MLVIRLSRTGRVHTPHYRIVVQERRSKLNGGVVDTIGHYHPAQAGKLLVLDKEKAQRWLANGAQASATVTNLFVKEGVLPKTAKVHNFFTPKKQDASKPAEKSATAKAEPAEEAVPESSDNTESTPEDAEEAEEAPEAVPNTEDTDSAESKAAAA